MLNSLGTLLRRLKYGKSIYVVSGLPRSGTSMLMNMLSSGGLDVLMDEAREADLDNPRGYFEFQRIKNLEHEKDKSWLRAARGKAVKVISHLLKELPDENDYLVIFARRDLREVIASQNIMLERQGEANPIDDDKAIDLYKKHLINIRVFARRRANVRLLELHYAQILSSPRETAEAICKFIGQPLDIEKMSGVVDRNLHRNRIT